MVDAVLCPVRGVHRKPATGAVLRIMSGRTKTKVRQKVPISPALADVLDELDREPKKLTILLAASVVFTCDGKASGRMRSESPSTLPRKKRRSKLSFLRSTSLCFHTLGARWHPGGTPQACRGSQPPIRSPALHQPARSVTQELRQTAESAN
jgi:hypothetical protein